MTIEQVYKEVTVDSTQTSFDYVKLFTCYEQPKLSFVMYISPFDVEIWIFILCSGAITCILFSKFQKVLNLAHVEKSFTMSLFVVGALITFSL